MRTWSIFKNPPESKENDVLYSLIGLYGESPDILIFMHEF